AESRPPARPAFPTRRSSGLSVYPRGAAHPRYANPSRCNPGKDEHQLVRGAAGGEPAHRASKRATLFAPGGGCSYKATPEESWLIEFDRGPWARRSQVTCTPRGAAHPRYANPSRCNPGTDEHQLVHPSLPSQLPQLPNPRHSLRPRLKRL